MDLMELRPNIFDYATSELSQDAFLAWLLNWADKRNKKYDSSLNSLAATFVRDLLKMDRSFNIETVEVNKQWNNIDVCALVNNKYFIVIEDKKSTLEHSDQLKTYSDLAKDYYKHSEIKIKLIYFKMEEQGDYSEIEKSKYYHYKRGEMLSLLKNYIKLKKENKNDIIIDYYNNLLKLDKEMESYKTLPLDKWYWNTWIGFYSELQKQKGFDSELQKQKDKVPGWAYVPNKAGGFLGFWWFCHTFNFEGREFDFFLLLEESRFVFKIHAYKDKDRRVVRDFYREHLFKKSKELNIDISKFGRVGNYMGVAELNSDYRKTNESGILDFQSTVDNLKRLMKLLQETHKSMLSFKS